MFRLSFQNYSGPAWGEGFAEEPAVARQPKVQPRPRPAPGDRLEAFIELMNSLNYAEGHAEMREQNRKILESDRRVHERHVEIMKSLQEELDRKSIK